MYISPEFQEELKFYHVEGNLLLETDPTEPPGSYFHQVPIAHVPPAETPLETVLGIAGYLAYCNAEEADYLAHMETQICLPYYRDIGTH